SESSAESATDDVRCPFMKGERAGASQKKSRCSRAEERPLAVRGGPGYSVLLDDFRPLFLLVRLLAPGLPAVRVGLLEKITRPKTETLVAASDRGFFVLGSRHAANQKPPHSRNHLAAKSRHHHLRNSAERALGGSRHAMEARSRGGDSRS